MLPFCLSFHRNYLTVPCREHYGVTMTEPLNFSSLGNTSQTCVRKHVHLSGYIIGMCPCVTAYVTNTCLHVYLHINCEHARVNTHGCYVCIGARASPRVLFAHVLTCGSYVSYVRAYMCEHR